MRSTLRIVMTAEAKIRRAKAIRGLPAAKRLAAWTKFINELAPGKIKGAFTVQQADDWFEKQWLPAQARRVRVCTAKLKELVRKMNSVRGARFRRIEVRACNMGADRTTLKTVREFFGAARVLAPNVGTFYVLVRPFVPRKPQALQRWLRQYGGRAKGGVYAGRQGPATRSFDVYIAARHSMQAFLIPKGFHLRVWEISQTPHRYQARAAAAEWSHVKAWVDHNIMPLSSYRRGAFYLAGMWTFGKGRLPYAVPSEREYRGRIVSQPP